MKEVLFRGKTVDTNEWVQGSLVRALGYLDEDEKFFIIPEDALYYNHGEFDIVKEVRSETVGQYTGFKDKHGVKIFEGAIVKEYSSSWKTPSIIETTILEVVRTYFGSFHLSKKTEWGEQSIALNRRSVVEVIGNIHDNPNLLDEEVKE